MSYATDGKCHNAEPGTYGHECGKPATWLGTNGNGFTSGFCDACKRDGWEARGKTTWVKLDPQDHDCTHLTRQWMSVYLVAEGYDFESWGHFPGQFTLRILRNGVVRHIITAPSLREAEDCALRRLEAEARQ